MGMLMCTGPFPWWVVSSMASLISRLQYHSSSSVCTSGKLTDIFTNPPNTFGCGRVCPSICPIHAEGRSAEMMSKGICW